MDIRTDLTPPPPGPHREFRVVKNVEEKRAVVVSPRIWAHHIHWLGNVSCPCESEVGACTLCNENKPRRWQGYLFCLDYSADSSKGFFLCITPKAGYELMGAEEYKNGLRGKVILYRRATRSASSALILRFDAYLQRDFSHLPDDLNPKPYLEQLFKKVPHRGVQPV